MSTQEPQKFPLRMRSTASFAPRSVAKLRRGLRQAGTAADDITVSRITVIDVTSNDPPDVIEMRARVTFAQMAAVEQFDNPIVVQMLRGADLNDADLQAAIDEAVDAGFDRSRLEEALLRPGQSFKLEAIWQRAGDPDEVEAWRQQLREQLASVGASPDEITEQSRTYKRLVRSRLTAMLSLAQARAMQLSEHEVAAGIAASGAADGSDFDEPFDAFDPTYESLLIEADRAGFNRQLLEAELEWLRADRFSSIEADAAESVATVWFSDDLPAAVASHPNFLALAQRAGIELWTEDVDGEWETTSFADGDEWPDDDFGLALSIDFTLAQAKAVGYSVEEVATFIQQSARADRATAVAQAIDAGFDTERLNRALAERDDAAALQDRLMDLMKETDDTAEVAYSIASTLDDQQRSLNNPRYDLKGLVEAAVAAGHDREQLKTAFDQWFGADPLPLTTTEEAREAREAEWGASDEEEEYV